MLTELIRTLLGGVKFEKHINVLIKASSAVVINESAKQVAVDLKVLGAKVSRDDLKASLEALYSGYILIWNKGDSVV